MKSTFGFPSPFSKIDWIVHRFLPRKNLSAYYMLNGSSEMVTKDCGLNAKSANTNEPILWCPTLNYGHAWMELIYNRRVSTIIRRVSTIIPQFFQVKFKSFT